VLSLARCHPGHHTRSKRLIGSSDDVLIPIPDHDGTPIQIGSPGELEVSGQTTADAHVSSCVRRELQRCGRSDRAGIARPVDIGSPARSLPPEAPRDFSRSAQKPEARQLPALPDSIRSGKNDAEARGVGECRPGVSSTPISTVPERLAADSSGPIQCSGTSPLKG